MQSKFELKKRSIHSYSSLERYEQIQRAPYQFMCKIKRLELICHEIIICCELFILTSFFSCKKFIQIPPPSNQLVSSTVFSDDNIATAALTGIYSNMMQYSGSGVGQLPLNIGVSSDELVNYSTDQYQIQFYTNSVSPTSNRIAGLWGGNNNGFYGYIFDANSAIEGLNSSTGVSAAVKQELLGEAKFIRAFSYFYLVNFFGDVPLVTNTDYSSNSKMTRTPQAQVYQQIIADLEDAANLLPTDYSFSNGERVRPNKWAANALLARTFLYTQNWDSAVAQATSIINNSLLYSLDTLNGIFLKNSTEAIWQLQPVVPGYNTWDGYIFILTSSPSNVTLSNTIVNAFDSGDLRRTSWVDSLLSLGETYYYAYKYKVKTSTTLTEYYMVLRLAEQYLIRAEAEAQQNNIPAAQADLNIIRNRAGLPKTSSGDQQSLLSAIMKERQIEFFCEWGHRWLDLKRTSQIDSVLGIEKPGFIPSASLFPVLENDLLSDPNLTQNPGY